MTSKTTKFGRRLAFAAAAGALLAGPALATHAWSTYHWTRAANTELTVPVGDNVDARW